MTTIAGTGTGGFSDDGTVASSAQVSFPQGVAVSSSGEIYVSDTSNNIVRKARSSHACCIWPCIELTMFPVSLQILSSGVITTFAGISPSGIFSRPTNVVPSPTGDLYIVDSNNHVVVKVAYCYSI